MCQLPAGAGIGAEDESARTGLVLVASLTVDRGAATDMQPGSSTERARRRQMRISWNVGSPGQVAGQLPGPTSLRSRRSLHRFPQVPAYDHRGVDSSLVDKVGSGSKVTDQLCSRSQTVPRASPWCGAGHAVACLSIAPRTLPPRSHPQSTPCARHDIDWRRPPIAFTGVVTKRCRTVCALWVPERIRQTPGAIHARLPGTPDQETSCAFVRPPPACSPPGWP
jgi:hypothetical protein